MTTTRLATVSSPLGKDVLLLSRMTATEELGRLSRFDLDLLSTNAEIKLEDLLGKPLTVTIELPGDKARHFNGVVVRFCQSGRAGRYTEYQVTVRPWLWLLTRTADCRIYPDPKEAKSKTVPEIVKDVFRENGFSDFKERLNGTYKAREFCVQYRETDFNFVSRLMEEEGIYYYVEHEEDKHSIVLADSPNSHDPIPGCEKVPYQAAPSESGARSDHISMFQVAHEVQTGVFALNDFDFEVTRADLTVKSSIPRSHAHAKFEVYDHPGFQVGSYSASSGGDKGDPDARDRGEGFARVRIQELHTDYEQIHGGGNVRGLAVGGLFKLTDFHREDQNRDYLVVATQYEVVVGGYEGVGPASDETLYRCGFTAIPSKTPFRPRRLTPKPSISGPQTATVVGKSGEEIWTDVHGRVKIQFHWDRYGGHDETSSCWVRVSHPWAGRNWGSVHIPRIGHEVVVEFLEGDPDRPIVTGSVYNGQNKPPYDLPDNQTQSGSKSRSTKEGTEENFNEIRFEDKKGEEQLFIHAEKNQDIEVENDETHWVGHDRTKTIDNDETTHVKNNRTETVDKEESITIGGNRTESVAKDETITISGNRTENVAKDEAITIDGNRTKTVEKDETTSITGKRTESVGKDESIAVSGKRTKDVAKDEVVSIGEKYSQSIGKDGAIQVGKNLTIQAGDDVVIKSGAASITLKKNGDVVISGKKVAVNASSDLALKGSKISQN